MQQQQSPQEIQIEERRRKRKPSSEEDNPPPWYAMIGKCAIMPITHPVEYVRVLIQLGYEPLEPLATRRLFGRPGLALPGMFTYMGYIWNVDGFFGLYRGFGASLCSSMIYNTVFLQVTARMPPVPSFEEDQIASSEDEKLVNFMARTSQEMVARIVAAALSQPLLVVSTRMMAQFIGGETKYNTIVGSIREIIHDEGVLGLWNGLMPRISGDVVRIWLAGSIAFFINNYIIEDPTVRTYISGTTNFLASSVTYPFHVVGTVMSVTGAPIQAGGPPQLARYESWTQCWKHLHQLGQIKRGSSLLWRYYYPIKVLPDGTPYKIPLDLSRLN